MRQVDADRHPTDERAHAERARLGTLGSDQRAIGHAGGKPAWRQAAAATAANTASDPFTGCRRGLDLDVDRRGVDGAQDAERPDREVERRAVVVDREALAAHPAQRHVRGAGAVAAQHDLVERISAPHTNVQRAFGVDRGRRRVAPFGAVTMSTPRLDRARRTDRGQQHGRLGPASRTAARVVGGPATSTSSTTEPGATDPIASAIPAVRATRTMPVPSARTPAAIGGRFGPRRTTSSRVNSTRTARPCRSARRRATSPTSVDIFPPNAPPLPSGFAGSHQAHTTRRPVRGTPAPPTSSAACASSRRAVTRSAIATLPSCARPWILPAEPARLGQRFANHPLAVDVEQATSASTGAMSSANPPRPSATCGPTSCATPPSNAARTTPRPVCARCPGTRSRGRQNGGDDGVPAGAAAQVGEEGLADGGLRRGIGEGGGAHDDARRAEAALAAAVGAERLRPAVGAVEALDRRDRTARRRDRPA